MHVLERPWPTKRSVTAAKLGHIGFEVGQGLEGARDPY